MLLTHPKLNDGRGLHLSKIVRGDTLIVKFRVSGDLTGAVIKFAARLRDIPLQPVVIQRSSSTTDQILIEQVTGALYADVTLHIPGTSTSVLDVGSVLEYDIELVQTVSYGGTSSPVTLPNVNQTINRGYFTLIDQVSI